MTLVKVVAQRYYAQQPCRSLDEGINTVWFIQTMEYYFSPKRKEILAPPITWMRLEDIMLSPK